MFVQGEHVEETKAFVAEMAVKYPDRMWSYQNVARWGERRIQKRHPGTKSTSKPAGDLADSDGSGGDEQLEHSATDEPGPSPKRQRIPTPEPATDTISALSTPANPTSSSS